ncbi:hypothetical protein CASFOL_011485 [Castilleja foliolosa]|uniref:Replication factor A C-terminal domain-containing protein n=1 Tax=Castilleja foliolosa TaxID=1961234 RepID=A0ABD3DVM3_9LAMI
MATSSKNDIEFQEIFELFSSRTARLLSLNYIYESEARDAKYWVEGTIVGVDTNKDLWYLSCKICTRKFEKVDGTRNCAHCQEVTYIDIYRATLVLCDGKTLEMLLHFNESVKTIPISVEFDIVGRKGLFEVIVTPENNDVEKFEVSRLTLDQEILDLYRDKYIFYQESSPDHPSFLNDSTYTSPDDLDIGYSSADQDLVICDVEAEEQEALNDVGVEVSTDQDNMTAAPACIASEGIEATIKEPTGSNDPGAMSTFKKRKMDETD